MIPLAVFGDPIAHSLSPQLHAIFAAQANLKVNYRAILAPPETFAQQLNDFFAAGGIGANITLPHKTRVLELATMVESRAGLAGAANTVSLQVGSRTQALVADNTDGEGLVRDLRRQFGDLKGMKILVLGAGGAVRGALGPLWASGCTELAVYNRTQANAQSMVQTIRGGHTPAMGTCNLRVLSQTDDACFDLIINGISAGHQGRFPLTLSSPWLRTAEFAYDMSYGSAARPFLAYMDAQKRGLRTADGLGMLVEQGALSFTIWTGRTVDTNEALNSMRQMLSASS